MQTTWLSITLNLQTRTVTFDQRFGPMNMNPSCQMSMTGLNLRLTDALDGTPQAVSFTL